MRYITLLLIFSTQLAFGQQGLINEMKAKIGTDWIESNPTFNKTTASYFDKTNIERYYIAPINWSGLSIPFFWDCDLSALEYLTKGEHKFNKLLGLNAAPTFKGTKLTWQDVKATIWVNQQYYDVELTSWHLMGLTECPGTTTFPSVGFSKTFELENALTNTLEGLVFISDELIKSNASSKFSLELIRDDGSTVKGTAFDIDGDKIADLFCFMEYTDEMESTSYRRMYANINGQWKCIYVELYEECI